MGYWQGNPLSYASVRNPNMARLLTLLYSVLIGDLIYPQSHTAYEEIATDTRGSLFWKPAEEGFNQALSSQKCTFPISAGRIPTQKFELGNTLSAIQPKIHFPMYKLLLC